MFDAIDIGLILDLMYRYTKCCDEEVELKLTIPLGKELLPDEKLLYVGSCKKCRTVHSAINNEDPQNTGIKIKHANEISLKNDEFNR